MREIQPNPRANLGERLRAAGEKIRAIPEDAPLTPELFELFTEWDAIMEAYAAIGNEARARREARS